MKHRKHPPVEDGFSFVADPSFSGHDEAWWREWRKNQSNVGCAPRICNGCLFQLDNGTCDIYDIADQRFVIGLNDCDLKLEGN